MDHVIADLGFALVIAAVAAALSERARFSIVPILILAGMALGPHVPRLGPVDLRFIESSPVISFLGRLGVLFLLFYLGLEFSFGRLAKTGRSIITGGVIYLALNFGLALLFGWALGWSLVEVLVLAGVTTISSSAIVAKTLVDLKRTANPETEMILGIILFEDVFLAVYMAIVSGLVLSGATSYSELLTSSVGAVGYMAAVLIIGRKAVPWLDRMMEAVSDEQFLLMVFAALLVVAGLSEAFHVAEAIGALLVGMVFAETRHVQRIERLTLPFRDFFGAFFFFGFGLSIDPRTLGGALGLALAGVVLTLIGNYAAGRLVGRISGLSPRASSNIGLTIVSRGEFSIIMANLARQGGLIPELQPFTALYVLVLAVLGPLLTKNSRRIHQFISGGTV